ncbi:aminomethyltransferase family protein [Arenicella sp. 4NH20-0111]|uniref:aminomethyltransferase family protein n=1 Tax=Arenicella sp. 4NH20-0111 TaxID=3127648 RepID=UPI0031052E86
MNALTALHTLHAKNVTSFNGIEVPDQYSDLDKEYKALRHNVALSDYSHYTKLKIEGDEAFDVLDIAVAGDVAEIRDEQTLYTVLLDEAGNIISDVYIMNDDDTYIVLSEHIDDETLLTLFKERMGEFDDVEFTSLTHSHAIIAMEGPYSWELAKEIYGMDVIGIPFLGFIALEEDVFLLRAGKHGEFSYKVILPNEEAEALWNEIEEKGERYELVKAGLALHKLTRLENPYFSPSGNGSVSRDPRELQLQWMVRYDKDEFYGREKLLEKREQNLAKKVVGVVLEQGGDAHTINSGDAVIYNGETIGKIVSCGYSPSLNKVIAQAILDNTYAYAGIDAYTVKSSDGTEHKIKTTATPFVNNHSMLINPNENSFVNPDKFRNMIEQLEAQQAQKLAEEEKASA